MLLRFRKIATLICVCFALSQANAAETVIVAAFGDSLVHGYGLNPDDGFAPQLNRWLAEQGLDAEVLNAGVSGETTAGGLARIDWTLGSNPDALILALGGNDVLRGLLPEESRRNLDGILARTEEAGIPVLLVGQIAPGNYGTDYKRDFEAIFPELAEKYQSLYFERFFAAFDQAGSIEEVRGKYFQEDGLHPSPEGVAVIVASIGPVVIELIKRVGN